MPCSEFIRSSMLFEALGWGSLSKPPPDLHYSPKGLQLPTLRQSPNGNLLADSRSHRFWLLLSTTKPQKSRKTGADNDHCRWLELRRLACLSVRTHQIYHEVELMQPSVDTFFKAAA